jgi:uncharacterized membrane protein
MDLPAIELPKIDLPFEVPFLLHPLVVHFAVAIPVIILLLEIYNVFARKKSIGGFSFILILLTIAAAIGAYFTGLTDGKESFDLLSEAGKEELAEHKLLGTYLLLASGLLLFFKLLAMTGNVFLRFLFMVSLIGYIGLTFIQGQHGGELTYEYGANVEQVKVLDDALFDANEKLEEMNATEAPKEEAKVVEPKVEVKPEVKEEVVATPVVEQAANEIKEEAPAPVTTSEASAPQTLKTEVTPQEAPAPQVPEVNTSKVDKLLENAKEAMKQVTETTLSTVDNTVEEVVEVVPTQVERPKIETH